MLSSSLLSPPPYISLSNLSPLIAGRRGKEEEGSGEEQASRGSGKQGRREDRQSWWRDRGRGIAGKQNVQTSGKRKGKRQNSNGDLFACKGHFSRKGRRTGMNRKVGKEGDRVLATCANAKWAILQRQKYFS